MAYLLLGLAFLLLLLLAARAFANASPARMARILKVVLLVLAVVLIGFLLIRGPAMVAAIPALVGAFAWRLLRPGTLLTLAQWLWRFRGQAQARNTTSGPSGDRSQVSGKVIRMTLDHASGAMDGEVLAGPFAGRNLATLEDDHLRDLHRYCLGHCEQSTRLLEAWLERRHGPSWRERFTESTPRPGQGPMTPDEAAAILGVGTEATSEEVREVHRRLLQRLHPDAGGSDHLAAMINEARDVLLASRAQPFEGDPGAGGR